MNTLDIIKTYTDNGTWTIVCNCKSCRPLGWLKVTVEDMAQAVDQHHIDFTDYRQLNKLNHKLIQQTK